MSTEAGSRFEWKGGKVESGPLPVATAGRLHCSFQSRLLQSRRPYNHLRTEYQSRSPKEAAVLQHVVSTACVPLNHVMRPSLLRGPCRRCGSRGDAKQRLAEKRLTDVAHTTHDSVVASTLPLRCCLRRARVPPAGISPAVPATYLRSAGTASARTVLPAGAGYVVLVAVRSADIQT